MLVHEGHQQTPVRLPPAWSGPGNAPLRAVLRRQCSPEAYKVIDRDARAFEAAVAGEIHDARLQMAEPKLKQFDQWGQRVDVLSTSEGWRKLKRVAAEQGLVSIAFERKLGPASRLHNAAKGYIWVPESGYVGCPLAMTDGCARVIELAGTPEMKRDVYPHLISRDPDFAWTAGQWMTEKPGGSDVSLTETVARPLDSSAQPKAGDYYELDGFKWFSSATDSDVALALARTGGEGSRGLSLFLIKLRDDQGRTNGIHVHRLKEKWGTKFLPTAELSISGCVGQLVGRPGDGVRIIASVLNITRMHSAISGVAALRRALDIARAFAENRHVGGKGGSLLSANEMHTAALAESELVHRALLSLTFDLLHLLGKSENKGCATKSELMRLRLLTPVAKTFSANLSTNEMLKTMEALGGQGYMEENEIGRLIADASVERIWEGTTNTLALDVVRVIKGTQGLAVQELAEWIKQIMASVPSSFGFATEVESLEADIGVMDKAARLYLSTEPVDPRIARHLLYHLGYIASKVTLVEHAVWSQAHDESNAVVDKAVASRWILHKDSRATMTTLKELTSTPAAERVLEREMDTAIMYGRPVDQAGANSAPATQSAGTSGVVRPQSAAYARSKL